MEDGLQKDSEKTTTSTEAERDIRVNSLYPLQAMPEILPIAYLQKNNVWNQKLCRSGQSEGYTDIVDHLFPHHLGLKSIHRMIETYHQKYTPLTSAKQIPALATKLVDLLEKADELRKRDKLNRPQREDILDARAFEASYNARTQEQWETYLSKQPNRTEVLGTLVSNNIRRYQLNENILPGMGKMTIERDVDCHPDALKDWIGTISEERPRTTKWPSGFMLDKSNFNKHQHPKSHDENSDEDEDEDDSEANYVAPSPKKSPQLQRCVEELGTYLGLNKQTTDGVTSGNLVSKWINTKDLRVLNGECRKRKASNEGVGRNGMPPFKQRPEVVSY